MKKEKCYDLGTIQAFTDSELTSDLQEKVIGHIALCDDCATLLADIEQESTFAFSVLDDELNVLVPTERLRAKVFDSIKESKEKVSLWQTIAGSLGLAGGFSFKNPSLVAFASFAIFASALGVGVYFYNTDSGNAYVAEVNVPENKAIDVKYTPYQTIVNEEVKTDEASVKPKPRKHFEYVKTGGIKKVNKKKGNKGTKTKYTPATSTQTANKAEIETVQPPSSNLSGEDSYLQTIATLSRTVNANKDLTLRPRERVAFERDMAVVDDAIKKMKKEVRKNPKNKAAREILRSSYKNKIDLLNSVAERTELMASLD